MYELKFDDLPCIRIVALLDVRLLWILRRRKWWLRSLSPGSLGGEGCKGMARHRMIVPRCICLDML